MLETLRDRWLRPGGGREVLTFSYPLVLTSMSFVVQGFINRLFLTWYSPEAVGAVMASLIATQVLVLPCVSTAEYTTTFVAQYSGAGRPDRIGPATWQAIWFAVIAALILSALACEAPVLFALAGHSPALQADESTYASILLLGAFPIVLVPALASFFAGRGETRVVLLVNLVNAATNVVLDYLWIFGHLGFREGGVAGAALATVAANAVGCGIFFILMIQHRYRIEFGTLRSVGIDPRLFWRLLRYGTPVGFHVALGMLGIALFTLIVGRLGTLQLAATGIAFSINGLVFGPMAGLGTGVMALTGRYIGSGDPDLAERVTWTAFGCSIAYLVFWVVWYIGLPHLLLEPYAAGANPVAFTPVEASVVVLLRFVAIYSFFDMMNAVFGAGLRGAGDTTFPFLAELISSWTVMLIPTYIACEYFGRGLLTAWSFASVDFAVIGLALLIRYRSGRWRLVTIVERSSELEETGI